MMKLFYVFLLMASFQLRAEVVIGHISSIDYPENKSEMPLLFMSDGSVLKLDPNDKFDLASFIEAKEKELVLKISIDQERQITGVESIGIHTQPTEENLNYDAYAPSVLNSETDARNIFNSMRRGAREKSQCYNRAHIWSYESKNNYQLNSMKVFIFFTRKYIREFNFHWWFHVSPFTYVQGLGINERVLDFKFTTMPIPMKVWSDIFMQNDAECPVIQLYSQYENNQDRAYCYLYKTSMYDYQPLDLKAYERTGAIKTNWLLWEVKNAYRDGFGIRVR